LAYQDRDNTAKSRQPRASCGRSAGRPPPIPERLQQRSNRR
jgi:hypothetical protein